MTPEDDCTRVSAVFSLDDGENVPRDMLWYRAPPRRRSRKPIVFFAGLACVYFGVFVHYGDPRDKLKELKPASDEASTSPEAAKTVFRLVPEESSQAKPTPRVPPPVERVAKVTLVPGQLPAQALRALNIDDATITRIFDSLKDLVDFRRLLPGHSFAAKFNGDDTLVSLTLNLGRSREFVAKPEEGGFKAEQIDKKVETVLDHIAGNVKSSLWDAMVATGERPGLIPVFVDIFAWEVDFYRDVRRGDAFEVLVEKRYVDGDFIGYGDILAARYTDVEQSHAAFRRVREVDGKSFYYDSEGRSMRKQLLKAPLQYGRVTSGFGRRRHPILGYSRQHNGVDYGVPAGTKVWSVGDGRVVRAGWAGGYGRLVAVQHANGWTSHYAHLSQIGVRVGQKVRQKDVIGRVGSSGLATGPHLHYELKKRGDFVNPATQHFERATALTGNALSRFKARVADLELQLDQARVARRVLDPFANEG